MNKRGRPIGTRLSEESKRKIAKSMAGHKTSDETKAKIAKSVKEHWNKIERQDVEEMLALYDARQVSVKDIADRFGITTKHLYALVRQREEKE